MDLPTIQALESLAKPNMSSQARKPRVWVTRSDLLEWLRAWLAKRGIWGRMGGVLFVVVGLLWSSWSYVLEFPGIRELTRALTQAKLPECDPTRFCVVVAMLDQDDKQQTYRLVSEALSEFNGIQVKRADRTLWKPNADPESTVASGHAMARDIAKTSGAQCVVWGTVLSLDGKRIPKLYWTSSAVGGLVTNWRKYQFTDDLGLPISFWEDLGGVLKLVLVTEVSRFEAEHGRSVADKLALVMAQVNKLVISPDPKLSQESQLDLTFILGKAEEVYALEVSDASAAQRAVALCRTVLNQRTRFSRPPGFWSDVQLRLAIALTILGSQSVAKDDLVRAVDAYDGALRDLPQGTSRRRLGVEGMRGLVLIELGDRTDDMSLLLEGVSVFRRIIDAKVLPDDGLALSAALRAVGSRQRGLHLDEALKLALEARDQDSRQDPEHDAAVVLEISSVHLAMWRFFGQVEHLEDAVSILRARLDGLEPYRLAWIQIRIRLAAALFDLGTAKSDFVSLRTAALVYQSALSRVEKANDPRAWVTTTMNLAATLSALGEQELDPAHLKEAIHLGREVLSNLSRKDDPRDWAMTQSNLSMPLILLGSRESETDHLNEGVQAAREALKERTRAGQQQDWATTMENLCFGLVNLGATDLREDGLSQALWVCRETLEVDTPEANARGWARVTSISGWAMNSLAQRSPALVDEAMLFHRRAVATAQRVGFVTTPTGILANLAKALRLKGDREANADSLEQSVATFRQVLVQVPREAEPISWALTTVELCAALSDVAERKNDGAIFLEAVRHCREALATLTRERVPRAWSYVSMVLGNTLRAFGVQSKRTDLLNEAVGLYRDALLEATEERDPWGWSEINSELARTVRLLRPVVIH